MRKRDYALMFSVLLISSGLFWACSTTSGDLSTIYRNPDAAQTVLIATESLRFHTAQLVAQAYMTGRMSKEQTQKYADLDASFRSAWGKAADLVQLWIASKTPPAGTQEAMAQVEGLARQLDTAGRGVQ